MLSTRWCITVLRRCLFVSYLIIADYSGANETYAKLLALANDGRVQYQSTMASHTPPCSGACVGEESLTRLMYVCQFSMPSIIVHGRHTHR